jgi:hypothetical protein
MNDATGTTVREHMRVRHLVLAAVAVLSGAAVVVLDARLAPGEEQVPVQGSMRSAIPYVANRESSASTWFCPGVPANDGSITSVLVLANSGTEDLAANITHLGTGVEPVVQSAVVPALATLEVEATGGLSSSFVSTTVEILGAGGLVEQVINHPAGRSIATCTGRTSDAWYFADGFTAADSIERIVITNPFSDASVVNVTFSTQDSEREPANLQGLVIAPRSVLSLSMAEQGARNEPVLAVSVRAKSGNVVAARSQHYLGQGRLGYVMNLGAMADATQWWFAGGERIEGSVEQLVIYNPWEVDRQLSVVFLPPEPNVVIDSIVVAVPAGRVATIDTSRLPGLPAGRYGINVSVLDDLSRDRRGVVVEQVITRRVGDKVATSIVLGTPGEALSNIWIAPFGLSPGLDDGLIVLNSTPVDARLSIEQVGPAGLVPIMDLESIVIPPGSLVVVAIPPSLPQAQVVVRSDQPIVVQRMLARGGELVGRTTALALPVLPMVIP